MREKIAVENAFERKLGSHGGGDSAESHAVCGAITVVSLSVPAPAADQQKNSRGVAL